MDVERETEEFDVSVHGGCEDHYEPPPEPDKDIETAPWQDEITSWQGENDA
jgi:hypothetical protein